MKRIGSKSKALVPMKLRMGHFSELASRRGGISLSKRFRAVAAFDAEKRPQWFLFDLYAFWEFLCRIDETLSGTLPDKEYFRKNPVGPLIDDIESRWPFKEETRAAIRKEYEQALREIAAGKIHSLKP